MYKTYRHGEEDKEAEREHDEMCILQWKNPNINIITNKMSNKSFVGRTSDWIGANKFFNTIEYNDNDSSFAISQVTFVFTPCVVSLCLSEEIIT